MKKFILLVLSLICLISFSLVAVSCTTNAFNNNNSDLLSNEDGEEQGAILPELGGEGLVKISEPSLKLYIGDSYQLHYTKWPANYPATWSSTDEKVATVNQSGKIVAVGKGKARIAVSLSDYVKSFCDVIVLSEMVPAYSISLERTDLTLFYNEGKDTSYDLGFSLNYGDTSLPASSIAWSSSNDNVVTVINATITPKSVGNAVVTAKYSTPNGDITKSCNVTVVAPYFLKIIDPVTEVYPYDEFSLSAKLYQDESCAQEITGVVFNYYSKNTDIIDYRNGKFIAKGCGDVELVVEYSGIKSAVTVRVLGFTSDMFELVNGKEGTSVSTSLNNAFTYTGYNALSDVNYMSLKSSAIQSVLTEAKEKGIKSVNIKVFNVNGVIEICPNDSANSLLGDESGTYLSYIDYVETYSKTNPYEYTISIDTMLGWDFAVLGMLGDGSFDFIITLQK